MSQPPIALVTGASRGLGRSTALALAARGVDVVVTYRQRADEAARAPAASACATFTAFASDLRGVLQQRFGRDRFDFLVNNAGVAGHAAFAQTSEAQFDELMRVHLKGPFFLTQALLPLLADGGRIVNVSSGLTRFALPGYAAYATMKGGIEVLTRYLAKELGARGIAVNTVAPGAIETDFGGGRVRDDAQLNAMIASQTALGRTGLPDDIGPMIAALLASDNRWVNAQRIEVSGGMFV
jgi:NAD(P)-dependent dehydrogenase (short-subunit alcohol dehydrogenase family)